MQKNQDVRYRLEKRSGPSVSLWQKPSRPHSERMRSDVAVEMGWGRLIFGQTFSNIEKLATAIRAEADNCRDIAFYIREPHVILALAPQELFLDPSHAFRMWEHAYRPKSGRTSGFNIRRLSTLQDAEAVNRLYAARGMVTCDPAFILERHTSRDITYFVAETLSDHQVIGTVTGVDHQRAFRDPENGSSLWCLAVDPQANAPGVGEALVRHLLEHFFTRGRNYLDLSVMHDNRTAIRLYEKLGFQRVPVFCVKRKNVINEPLYTGQDPAADVNPYARIIMDEARRRGIDVTVLDAEYGYFTLRHGGRAVTCREALSELTSAVAMSRCDDKRVTRRVLASAGLTVPQQHVNRLPEDPASARWVVKPARGEQGAGISVDVRTEAELAAAVETARSVCQDYIVEEYVKGLDLRVIVIDYEVVAAAVRQPPVITGTGQHSARALIEKYNRRRLAATDGESSVPLDAETRRCLTLEGYDLDAVIPDGAEIPVRKTANLHTGGTIRDVTDRIHPEIRKASVTAARALGIPVTGLDFILPEIDGAAYALIEANERPGLANHEPQPTAEKFIDLLFPQTMAQPA